MKGVLDLSPTPTLLRANQDGGAVRGAKNPNNITLNKAAILRVYVKVCRIEAPPPYFQEPIRIEVR